MVLQRIVPLVAAGAVAGILGVGGASLAMAQDTPSTTTPSTGDQAPSTDTPTTPDPGAPHDGNCPEKDGGRGDGSGTEGSSFESTTRAPHPTAAAPPSPRGAAAVARHRRATTGAVRWSGRKPAARPARSCPRRRRS
jgi:hypothetical protein